MIDRFSRYQPGLTLMQMFPQNETDCSCGCGNPLPKRRKRWASDECRDKSVLLFLVIKGDIQIIRKLLNDRDGGACNSCGLISDDWEADHITPVFMGGGGCGIENYQTLCTDCHKLKTKKDMFRNAPRLLHNSLQ